MRLKWEWDRVVLFGSWNRFIVLQFEVVVVVVTDGNDCGYYSEENIKSVLGTKLTQLTLENKILN